MQKERKIKVTFLNEVTREEALDMIARDIAKYVYEKESKNKVKSKNNFNL